MTGIKLASLTHMQSWEEGQVGEEEGHLKNRQQGHPERTKQSLPLQPSQPLATIHDPMRSLILEPTGKQAHPHTCLGPTGEVMPVGRTGSLPISSGVLTPTERQTWQDTNHDENSLSKLSIFLLGCSCTQTNWR